MGGGVGARGKGRVEVWGRTGDWCSCRSNHMGSTSAWSSESRAGARMKGGLRFRPGG